MDGIFTTRFVDPYLKFHVWAYERSDGRWGARSAGVPALLLTTTGARSGLPRTHGLTYAQDGDDLVVVASNGGGDRNPAWYHNILADPRVRVRVGRQVLDATARVAGPEERAELWPKVNRANRGLAPYLHRGVTGRYDVYQRHTSRTIPVVVIRPDPWDPHHSDGD